MKKTTMLAMCIALLTGACTKTAGTGRVNSQPTLSELTAVNMTPYTVVRPPPPSPVTIRSILGTDTAHTMGAESIYVYTPETTNRVRPYVLGPWNGLCFNEPSLNHIAASVNEVVLTTQNDEFLRLQTLGALAQRDLGLLQSDFRMMRASYQAQVNTRDISLQDSQHTIESLRQSNVWASVGYGVGGVLLGLGVSGILLLTR